MPCNPNDVSLNVPDGPSGPAIPGFGIPFALKLPNLNPFPDGFPEDLLDLLNKLQLLVPPGALKPQLNPNFGKDVFDAIMKLLDQFMPFLMLYKFFLPALELIICIIEVLCALMNPFKLIAALNRLFTKCIPAFLNMFPVFALIIMIISLLLLILALVEYVISQVLKLVQVILRNVIALQKAFADGDSDGVLAIAQKLGSLLCIFQNLFVLFALFNIIIQVIKDILSVAFSIPPCEDSDSNDPDNCCTPDVCPAIVKENYTNSTGILKYLPQVGLSPTLTPPLPPELASFFNFNLRSESWQLYDLEQTTSQQFRNIFDGYDVTVLPKPVFFPTDSVYNAQTDPKQAPYVMDLRLLYDPANWGRTPSIPRYIRFLNCVMTNVPSTSLQEGDLTTQSVHNAVANIVGGLGYEDDGVTVLTGFDTDGITPIDDQATLANFIHTAAVSSPAPTVSINDGYVFTDMTYTFKPHIAPLLAKNLVTLGCAPDLAMSRTFVNNIFAGDIALKTQLLRNFKFPDPGAAQQCLTLAVTTLSSNMTIQGVADFQATTNICLQKLKDDTNQGLGELVGIGFDPCKSVLKVNPSLQFTTKPIVVTVEINERNGLPLTQGISTDVATNLAARIKPFITFGKIDDFVYDGYQSFTANLTSEDPGSGTIMVAFDNNIFCTNDLNTPPTHTLQSVPYQFVYVPSVSTAEGDDDGSPRRDAGDLARAGRGS
jgi:hypothetical protein